MKALSIRQPWADLIQQGRKTLELRTWSVSYRGPLAIHASQTVEREACVAYGLDPDQVTTGAVIGVVDLVAVDALDAESFATRHAEHLSNEPFPTAVGVGLAPAVGAGLVPAQEQPQGHAPTLYGWRLLNPRPLDQPVVLRGRMGLFEAAVADPGVATEDHVPEVPPASGMPHLMARLRQGAQRLRAEERSRYPFDLQVAPEPSSPGGQAPYRLEIHQRSVEPQHFVGMRYGAPAPPMGHVAGLGGVALRAIAGDVIEALRANGYKPTDLSATRSEPFSLSEESGVRLALLFLAVRRLTKVDRMDVIAQGIRAMTSEEAYYWYAKCTGGPTAERAQKALRVLLADE